MSRLRKTKAAVALVAALTAMLLAAGAVSAQGPKAEPIAEVAPGIYMASGDDLAGSGDAGPMRATPRRRGAETRIVGGTTTTIAEWPWQVSLGVHPRYDSAAGNANQFDRHFCGGSLVAGRFVVGAAHCLYDSLFEADWVGPADFQVVSGRTQLSAGGGQVLNVADYYVFTDEEGRPLYNPDVYGDQAFDVAVIELGSGSSSQPIKLAGAGEEATWAPNRAAFVTGWGATSEGGAGSDVLKQAQIRMLADATCASAYGDQYVAGVMVCAGVLAGGTDACQGDSGGPLVVPIAGGGYRLVGDTSFGAGCARPGVPGVYGRVASEPIRSGLANTVQSLGGGNILGSGAKPPPTAQCTEALANLTKAKKALRKAKAKVKKAKGGGNAAKVKKAKKRMKKAKKRARTAKAAVAAAC